ncbi:MAG: hypothetical protein GX279_10750 [Clostridiaceae bacterium]|nr:hypothetical protein [Clostridiaceae bacterium]
MNKKLFAFLTALPALIVLSVFKTAPAIQAIIISFKYYNIAEGVFGSKSAGLANYIALFQNKLFSDTLVNTIVISLLSIIFTCVFAVLLILSISRLPSWILKTTAIVLIAVPAFIPAVSFASVFMDMFSIEGVINSILTPAGAEPRLFFAEQGYYPFLAAMMEAIRNVYIPVIIGVLVCESRGRKSGAGRICLVILGYIAARAVMLLSPDIESMILTSNPLTRGASEVIDTFIYRTGLQTLEMSLASASWVVKSFLQLVISTVAVFVLYFIMPYIVEFTGNLGEGSRTVRGSIGGIIGFIIFGSISVFMMIKTFIPAGGELGAGIRALLNDEQFVAALSNSLIFGVIGCLVYVVLVLFLAYPLMYSKFLYPLFLVILTSLSNSFTNEYLLYRQLNLINTIYPIIIGASFSAIGAFALHFSVSCRLKGASCGFGQYLRFALKPLVVIAVLAFITNWGGFFNQLIFITDTTLHGAGIYGYQMLLSQGRISMDTVAGMQVSAADIHFALVFILSVVPAALGALLIFLNKFLPLTAFSAHMRKG